MVADDAAEQLAADEAAAAIREAQHLEAPLRRRTEGVTWMIWGLVIPAVALTYEAVGDVAGSYAYESPWVSVLWVPWVLAGAATTYAAWTIPDLARSSPLASAREHVLETAGFVVAAAVVWGAVVATADPVPPDATALVALGVAWGGWGILGPFDLTETGRRASALVGLGLAGAGVGSALWARGAAGPVDPTTTAVLLAASAIPLVVGFVQALRG